MRIIKLLSGGIGSTTKTFSKSFKIIDDLIEKEHITGTIEKAKEMTGDLVQKTGEILEKGKMKVEELSEQERYKPIGEMVEGMKEKAIEIKDKVEQKIDDIKQHIDEEE